MPPPGRQWPPFGEAPWITWAVFRALCDASPEERVRRGLPADGCTPEGLPPEGQLALVEITPWRIAPGWAEDPLADERAEWTCLASEATSCGYSSPGQAAEELADLEDQGLLQWDGDAQAALLAADLDRALLYAGQASSG